jgi:predicted thioesterase
MNKLHVGLSGYSEMTVEHRHLASQTGNLGADVLSTHHVVLLMEQAARNAIQDRLPVGKITVGTMVRIRHMAATPLGAKVRAEAYLSHIQGKRLAFNVAAFDTWGVISEGENIQFIVSLDRFLERVNEKQLHMGLRNLK